MKDSQLSKKEQNQKNNKEKKERSIFSSAEIVIFQKKSLSFFQNFFTNTVKKLHLKKAWFKKLSLSGFIRKYETDVQFVLIPVILFLILATLVVVNNYVLKQIGQNKVNTVTSPGGLSPYPFVANVVSPEISAKAAIITDAESQAILFSKNPHLRFSMASTTKIMTALAALEHFQDDSIITIKSYGIEGSSLGFYPGQRFYFKDLLYAMLLPSANDAAYAIAENYPGGIDAFIAKMNEKAAELHLKNTHFGDPTGLNDDENYTTVIDMARLASHAIKSPEFTEIASTKEKVITDIDYGRMYHLQNLNKLLGTGGVYGIKTGTTEGAGEVLVTSTNVNNHTYILVVMNSQERFIDTKKLLDFIAQNVQFIMPPLPVRRY